MSNGLDTARRLLQFDFLRFLFVGGLNTAFGYTIYLIILASGMDPGVALAVATVIGTLFNFMTTGRLVFRQQGLRKLGRFLAAYAGIYTVNLLALCGLIRMGMSPQWAQGVLAPVIAVIAFLMFKYLVFGNQVRGEAPKQMVLL